MITSKTNELLDIQLSKWENWVSNDIKQGVKAAVNFGASISKLLIAFMNLLRVPVNGVIDFVQFFARM